MTTQKKLFIITSIIFLLGSILLWIPSVQSYLYKSIIPALGMLYGANLDYPDFWKGIVIDTSIILFSAAMLSFLLYIHTLPTYTKWTYNIPQKKRHFYIAIGLIIFFSFLFIFPFIFWGENSIITIHDNLDDSVPRFSYIHQNHLFFAFNKSLPVMNGISTLFFNREGFTFYNLIYCLLPTYIGYVTNYIICAIIGFVSMFYLQHLAFKRYNLIIITLVSLSYAFLPSICSFKMALASMPFAVIFFYKLALTTEKKWLIGAFFLPFFSELSGIGIFICGVWGIATIICCIKQKKITWSLLWGGVLLGIGYCLVNYHLIFIRLIIAEPLNRDFFHIAPEPFISSFTTYFFNGYYHAGSLQKYLLNWVVLGMTTFFLYRLKKKKHIKNRYSTILFTCLLFSVFATTIAALSDAHIINQLTKNIFPPLAGVSFARIYTIMRMTWYIAFSACLLYLCKIPKCSGIACTLAVLQVVMIFIGDRRPLNPYYSDAEPTWRHHLIGSDDITYKEFYSVDLFNEIKNKISYNGEKVAALGFHPGILLYNGFNTVDGYISFYPYKQQLLWHDLMLSEFEQNAYAMNYFDSWGGRRYIYNKDLSYEPTKEKKHVAINLNINMEKLKSNFGCKYILSRTKIANAETMGLRLFATFDNEKSIYEIWVYEIT